MLKLTIRGLLARKRRTILSAFAVALGVMLMTGTYVLTDTIDRSFSNIFDSSTAGTDISITGRSDSDLDQSGSAPPAIDAKLVDQLKRAPGVAAAAGSIFEVGTILDGKGKRLGASGAPSFIASVNPERFEAFQISEGRMPASPGEVTIDKSTAKNNKLKVGGRIFIAADAPKSAFTIVGVAKFSGVDSFGGSVVTIVTLSEAQRLTGNIGKVSEIEVAAAEGVSAKTLKARLKSQLPKNLTVRTGKEQAKTQKDQIREGLGFLRTALLIFAGISLFVGAFIVFNTFSITVSQRTREFGLLRLVGATRRQILKQVLAEGALLGLLGSVVGFFIGLGLVPVLKGLLKVAFGADFPADGLVIASRTVASALIVGMLVTLVSSLFPALRATHVTPIAALSGDGVEQRKGRSRLVAGLGLLLAIGGVATLLAGLFGGSLLFVGIGSGATFIGVAMLSPQLVKPAATVIGWPLQRMFGITGQLARANTARQPGRTAITASALMVGVTLVSFVTIFAAGMRDSIDAWVSDTFTADLIVQNSDGFSPLDPGVGKLLAATPGVESSSPLVFSQAKLNGKGQPLTVTAASPQSFGQLYKLTWRSGNPQTLMTLDQTGAILNEDYAKKHQLSVGNRFTLRTRTGANVPLTVRGMFDPSGNLNATGDVLIDVALARKAFGEQRDSLLLAKIANDREKKDVQKLARKQIEGRFPAADVFTKAQYSKNQNKQVDQLLMMIYVLLALAVIVSLFGIVNTLTLAISERTRELGLLRAVGTSSRQIRRMVRYEAIITALLGAAIGLVLGTGFAVAVTSQLKDDGFTLSIPLSSLVMILILAALAGVLAAILPARRAAKLNVLEALQHE